MILMMYIITGYGWQYIWEKWYHYDDWIDFVIKFGVSRQTRQDIESWPKEERKIFDNIMACIVFPLVWPIWIISLIVGVINGFRK